MELTPVVMAAQAGYSPSFRAVGDRGICIPRHSRKQSARDGRPVSAWYVCSGVMREGFARSRMGRRVRSMVSRRRDMTLECRAA